MYKDRDQFAALVREVAAPDVGRMGIEILSFTIKDVYDDVQYLASLGKSQTASVKRDADTGVAEANRDAGIREAECEKSAMDVKYATDTKIEDNARMFKLQKANFDQEINTAVRTRYTSQIRIQQIPFCAAQIDPYLFLLVLLSLTFVESRISTGVRIASSENPAKNS